MEDPAGHVHIINCGSEQSPQVNYETVTIFNELDTVENNGDVPQETKAVKSTAPVEEFRVRIHTEDPEGLNIISSSSKQPDIVEIHDDDDGSGGDDDNLDIIRRVPLHMEPNRYHPVVVSIGPYHHSNSQYSQMEEFKKHVLNEFIEKSVEKDATKGRNYIKMKIVCRINEIRRNYEVVALKNYSDKALAKIILRDAAFLVSFMESSPNNQIMHKIYERLGGATAVLVKHDLLMVENQIPFWIVMELFHIRFSKEDANKIVRECLSRICFREGNELKTLPWEHEEERFHPIHLLDACQATLSKYCECPIAKHEKKTGDPDPSNLEIFDHPDRSVTYLQAKGIYFKPSSKCLKDVTFTSYHIIGVLHLPILFFNNTTKALLQNAVAYGMFREGISRDAKLISYANFMKSLIDTPRDVKELRERGIIFSTLGSDEDLVKEFKEIHTYGVDSVTVFQGVKSKIHKHCESKAKTWIADLFNDYCRGPWAAISILAATTMLILTAIQVHYAIHPKH